MATARTTRELLRSAQPLRSTQLLSSAQPLPSAAGTLTRRVAERLTLALTNGTWVVGDRLPSIRVLARDWEVSISTVLAAFARLEDAGLIERRPRSGLFVRQQPKARPEPAVSRPAPRGAASSSPTTPDLGALALQVFSSGQRPDLVQYGTAVPDPALLPLAQLARYIGQQMRDPEAGWAAYVSPSGLPALATAIARRAQAQGCVLPPDEVVITTGAMEALTLALRATCKPGDVVAIESPIYFGILQLIGSLNLRVVEIPTHPQEGMQLDALREAIDEHQVTAVLAIASFNNPLGSCMSPAARAELVTLLAERDLPLIEDDIYGELVHHGPRPAPARSCDRDGRVLLCSSFSKCVAPGLRVGWVAGGRYAETIRQLKLTSTLATATLPQLALADLLDGGGFERHLRTLRRVCGERCASLADAVFASFPEGTRITRPTGGFVLWVELPRTVDAVDLHRLATEAGIALAPGHLFSAKRRYQHFIRLNASIHTTALTPSVNHLGRLAKHLARKP